MTPAASSPPNLTRFAWLAIAVALATISLKAGAYLVTGSVGLLSDALESVVNLIAAIAALIALKVAAKGPDKEHAYGHGKAEYFSSGFEGVLILIAAFAIAVTAIPRLLHPVELEKIGIGLLISVGASLLNGAVAWRLFRAASTYSSITLLASARHLLTDIWTSAGVLAGVGLVALTGWERLDPLVALIVAANIVWTGGKLIRASLLGLLDTALPPEDLALIDAVLERYRTDHGIETHALRTRQAGAHRFMSVHVLVPGDWSVQQGHQLTDQLEQELYETLPPITVVTHLESLDDPASWNDIQIRSYSQPATNHS